MGSEGRQMKYSPYRKRITLMPAIAMAALAALVAFPALSQSRLYAAGPQRFVTVTVRPGDNLWDIAGHYTPGGANVQDTIDHILAVNGKSSAVVTPGEHLKIPE
jgi:Tfp pilus assembly protein FimV